MPYQMVGHFLLVNVQNPFTMEEVSILVEAARRISYSGVINAARGTQIAVGGVMSKSPKRAFKDGIKPYVEGAKP